MVGLKTTECMGGEWERQKRVLRTRYFVRRPTSTPPGMRGRPERRAERARRRLPVGSHQVPVRGTPYEVLAVAVPQLKVPPGSGSPPSARIRLAVELGHPA